jgi:Fe-S-cluster-containing dehydrogenase component
MGACKQENDVALGSFWVQAFTSTTGDFPETETYFIPILCQQCKNPSCVPSCSKGVFEKRADGIVTVDAEKCSDCSDKPCLQACPYGVIYYNEDDDVVGKCDMCAHRVDEGLEPACSFSCTSRSWVFGDIDDPESTISKYLAAAGGYVHYLKPETGNEPSVAYVLSTKTWQGTDNLRIR